MLIMVMMICKMFYSGMVLNILFCFVELFGCSRPGQGLQSWQVYISLHYLK